MMGHSNVNLTVPSGRSLRDMNNAVARLRRENAALNDQLAARHRRIQGLEDELQKLGQNLQNATKKISGLEKQREEKDDQIEETKYSISVQETKLNDLSQEVKKAKEQLQGAWERRAQLESQLIQKNNKIAELKEDQGQLVNRIDRLSVEKQELQRKLIARSEERCPNVVVTEEQPSPNRVMIDFPEGPSIAQELNICPRCQRQDVDSSDAATDVEGLILTKQIGNSACLMTRDVATIAEGLTQENQAPEVAALGTQTDVLWREASTQTCTLMVREQSTGMTAQFVGHKTPFSGNRRESQGIEVFSRIPNWIIAFILVFVVYAWVTFPLGMPDVMLYMRRVFQYSKYTGPKGPFPT